MNEKTRVQIENMKKQTIGVEVEMNNITRVTPHGVGRCHEVTEGTAPVERKPQGLPPTFSEQADFRTQQTETDTSLGRLGTQRAENGNSKGMFPLQDRAKKNANW